MATGASGIQVIDLVSTSSEDDDEQENTPVCDADGPNTARTLSPGQVPVPQLLEVIPPPSTRTDDTNLTTLATPQAEQTPVATPNASTCADNSPCISRILDEQHFYASDFVRKRQATEYPAMFTRRPRLPQAVAPEEPRAVVAAPQFPLSPVPPLPTRASFTLPLPVTPEAPLDESEQVETVPVVMLPVGSSTPELPPCTQSAPPASQEVGHRHSDTSCAEEAFEVDNLATNDPQQPKEATEEVESTLSLSDTECQLCGEDGGVDLWKCPVCLCFQHRSCAQAHGDANQCWACCTLTQVTSDLIDDSELTEETRELTKSLFDVLHPGGSREAPGEDSRQTMKQRWQYFLEKTTAAFDDDFAQTTEQIQRQLLSCPSIETDVETQFAK